MDSVSRRYYEQELGAGIGPSMSGTEHFGYTEPLRRFVQREGFEPQANEIPNTAPSWLPGDDYYTNFKVGDPFIKVDQGYAHLPGAGYEGVPGVVILPHTKTLARPRGETAPACGTTSSQAHRLSGLSLPAISAGFHTGQARDTALTQHRTDETTDLDHLLRE